MKKLRRLSIIIVLLVLLNIFNVFPGNKSETAEPILTAQALTYVGVCGEDAKWELDTKLGRLTLTGKGETEAYTPDDPAPWNKYSDVIKQVVIEKGITRIGDYSFYRMTSIRSVTLPKSLKAIGKFAFMGCESLLTVENEMASSLETIGERAFAFCRALYKMPVSSSVRTIEKEAFLYCYSLRELTLGNSVINLGENALSCCCNMDFVEIVNSGCEIFDSPDTVYRDIIIKSFKKSTAYEYSDTYIRKFSVIKNIVSLDDLTATLKKTSYIYDGKYKRPTVTIKKLVNGKDYTVDYVNNKEPGIATAVASAAGSVVGETRVNFRILPASPEGLVVGGRTTKTVTLKWDATHGATKYQLFMRSGTEWVKVAETEKPTFKVTGLTSGRIYVFRLRAVTQTKKGICRGGYSKTIRTATKPDIPKIAKLSLVRGGGKVRVTLNGVGNADGYEIFMSDKENGTFTKTATLTGGKLKYTADGLSNSNTYYFKVRAYVNVGKSKVYSAFSTVEKSNVL